MNDPFGMYFGSTAIILYVQICVTVQFLQPNYFHNRSIQIAKPDTFARITNVLKPQTRVSQTHADPTPSALAKASRDILVHAHRATLEILKSTAFR